MHLSPAISRYVNDARVWIVFFFLLRLVHITQPPLEVVHNWRQCTVAMAARNFCETDNNILMPRLDIGGSGSGVEAMEFPLLNYAIYIVARVFGYDHWYGRLLVLLVSSVAMWYFYKILRLRYSEKMALYAMLLLQCSLWLMYMRKMMPDTWSVSLIIIGMY